LIETRFASPFNSYALVSSGYAIAYGVCSALGCNSRNVTVTLVTGDTAAKLDFAVYRVVMFWLHGAAPPPDLNLALPSADVAAVGSVAYGIFNVALGAVAGLTGIYPASARLVVT